MMLVVDSTQRIDIFDLLEFVGTFTGHPSSLLSVFHIFLQIHKRPLNLIYLKKKKLRPPESKKQSNPAFRTVPTKPNSTTSTATSKAIVGTPQKAFPPETAITKSPALQARLQRNPNNMESVQRNSDNIPTIQTPTPTAQTAQTLVSTFQTPQKPQQNALHTGLTAEEGKFESQHFCRNLNLRKYQTLFFFNFNLT